MLQLAVSPQPRVSGEHISVTSGTHQAVKVEGVLQHGNKPNLFRKAAALVLTVTTHLITRAASSHDLKVGRRIINVVKIPSITFLIWFFLGLQTNDVGSTVLTQIVKPHRDFFKAEFLLAFTAGGQYQVIVDAAINDETGFTWQIGVKSVLNVKVHEESQSSRVRSNVT